MDFVLVQQALTNLLLNAAVHTPSGTPVQVSAAADSDALVLTVADRGPGLPAEALPLIFDKFYRAPAAPAGGTGLGLAIVKGFVEAQGGQVKARESPRRRRRLYYPAALGQTAADLRRSQPSPWPS